MSRTASERIRGHAVVGSVRHPLVPGTACFLGYDVTHEPWA
jgi:hypothetical protein